MVPRLADARQVSLSTVSGEHCSWQTYGWGTYSARLKASRTPGTLSALFTYTGPSDGTQHDEIDVEIKGDDPTKVSLNYWTNGVEHPTVIHLGLDASLDLHDYAKGGRHLTAPAAKGPPWVVPETSGNPTRRRRPGCGPGRRRVQRPWRTC